MKYTLTINQNISVEWKLTASESIVFSWIYELPSWADKMEYNGTTYYFGSRNVACKELPIITDKVDTMYRLYKSLEKKGLISMVILQKKDYIAITEKGKKWHYDNELPNDGKISEETRKNIRENSEKNPTNKYTNDKDTKDENIVEDKKEWRESFDAYLNLVYSARDKVLIDAEYRQYIEKYYPNSDYNATLNKLVDGFWGKNEGWEFNKSKRKGKTINMVSTLKKNMDKRERIVYRQKDNRKKTVYSDQPKVKLHPALRVIDDDGKLSDGTYLKNGGRFYFSISNGKSCSIPPSAEPMPSGDGVFEYDYKLGWYECE